MITLVVCVAFLLLAALNATFSQPPNDFVRGDDGKYFLPPGLKSEGVYRSFVINVAFLGIATVTGFQFGTSTQFVLSGSALLAIVANLVFGFIAGVCLHSDARPFWGTTRDKMVVGFVLFAILLFTFSVVSVYQSTGGHDPAG
jgi:hypothetical protein